MNLMRVRVNTIGLCCALLLASGCRNVTKNGSYIETNAKDGANTSVKIVEDGMTIEMFNSDGLAFAKGDSAIAYLPEGAAIQYKHGDGSLGIKADATGKVLYNLNKQGYVMYAAVNNQAMLISMLRELISVGLGAKERALRLYTEGGVAGVTSTAGGFTRQHVRGAYLGSLLLHAQLPPAELELLLHKAAALLYADDTKKQLLEKVAVTNLAGQPGAATAYWNLLSSMSADFEKGQVLKRILQQPAAAAFLPQVLEQTSRLNADFEKANLFKEVLSKEYGVTQIETVLSSLHKSIGSDFEKAGVLRLAAESMKTGDSQWVALISEAGALQSEFEKSNLLVDIATKMPPSNQVRNAYLIAAKSIQSTDAYGRVMKAVQ